MNVTQNAILELWKQLSTHEKKEVLQHLELTEAMVESVQKFKGESNSLNFGAVTTCPTCGK